MNFVFVAGEVSGDDHGADLIAALRSNDGGIQCSGIGGDRMTAQGFNPIYHIRQMAFLGIGEVIKHLPFIRKVYRDLICHIKAVQPDAVILIDYPGFNLKIARKIKSMGIPVIYYISPQLWAWGKGRVKKMRRFVDKLLVIFPFEVEFYAEHSIRAEYVGHPFGDRYADKVHPKVMMAGHKRVLGLLPGSRKQELEKLLPDMLQAASLLRKENKIDEALIARVPHIAEEVYTHHTRRFEFVNIIDHTGPGFYNGLDAALVSSGTATLETAYFQVPMVIVYRVSALTWALGKILVKLDTIGMANIVAGQQVAEELLQNDFTPGTAAECLSRILEPEKNTVIRDKLKIIRKQLGGPGASARAAKLILEFITATKTPHSPGD